MSHGSYLFYEAVFANAATTCAGHRDKGLGSRHDGGGLAREESFNMISSTRFRLCLHAIISDFTGRELSHRRFSCDDPLSVGHFDSGRIARLLRLLAAPATRASVLDAPAKLDTTMWYLYCTALPQVALKLA